MFRLSVFAAAAATVVSGMELTPANWDSETAGKSVFIKFLAPWCGHCKSMKPAWDKLMKQFKGNPTALVADVDCTAAGQPLCEKNGVKGYPTLKYGDPNKLTDYQGGRDFDAMKQFAENNLGPKCGPENLDLCKGETKELYEKLLKMDVDPLEAETRAKRKEFRKLEEDIEIYKNAGRHVRKLDREKKAAAKKAEKEAKKAASETKDKAEL